MGTMRYYIDSNCLSYCLRPRPDAWTLTGVAAIRAQVTNAIQSGEIEILGSHYHLEEASRIGPGLRSDWMAFFWDAVRWYLLRPTDEVSRLEVELRRPLRGNEPFDEYDRRQHIRKACLRDTDILDSIASAVMVFTKNSGDDSKKRRVGAQTEVAAAYKGQKVENVTAKWWSEAEYHIADWMTDFMRNNREALNLPADESQWPKPKQLPTTWAIHAYEMARIVMTVGMNRKIRNSDAHDAQHYAMACFADVLVTDDGDFRTAVSMIPNGLKAIPFDEFAVQLGVRPH